MWAEAPHQGLARSQFWAFYLPLESPWLPIGIHFGNRIELTLLAPNWKGIRLAGLHYGATKDGARTHTAAAN